MPNSGKKEIPNIKIPNSKFQISNFKFPKGMKVSSE
jgi:hypothetical protein